jgi:hypothetical protein
LKILFKRTKNLGLRKNPTLDKANSEKAKKLAWTAIGASLLIALSIQIFNHFNKKESTYTGKTYSG